MVRGLAVKINSMAKVSKTKEDVKKAGRPLHGSEKKVSFNVYLEPSVKEKIIEVDGSLTASLEHRHKQILRKKKSN